MKEVNNFWNTWYSWLRQETSGYDVAVEFGAGFFDKLATVNCSVKIGIEKYEPYIDNAKYNDCTKVHGDMRDYKTLLGYIDHEIRSLRGKSKVAVFIDTLEHLEKTDGLTLLAEVKQDFDKIVIMVPNGNIYQDKDVTGFDNHEGQTHRSKWFGDDLEGLGFNVMVDNNFHRDFADKRSYFATWEK